MKKFVLFVLTIVYLIVSSGFAVEVHYCMGKRAGIDFSNTENLHCGHCGMKEKKGGCCTDEHRFYKLADAHKNVVVNHNFSGSKNVATHQIFTITQNSIVPLTSDFFSTKFLPCHYGPPIFLRNCVFLI